MYRKDYTISKEKRQAKERTVKKLHLTDWQWCDKLECALLWRPGL